MEESRASTNFSLKFSLSCSFLGVVLLTSILFGAVTYPNIKGFIRDGIKERLSDAASIAALQVDAVKHSKLSVREDENKPEYKELQLVLRKIRDHGTGMRFVYTLRKNESGKIVFIVDAEEKETDVSHIGDVYETETSVKERAFIAPYKPQVEDEFYTDKWGTWLTSYAPILDAEGNLDAVLAIDMSAEKVMAYERQYLMIFLGVVIVVSILVSIISLMISRRICQPMLLLEKDMAKMERFVLDDNLEVKSRIIEINNMAKAVDNMKNGLRSFKKYVPAELVSELITLHKEAELGAEKKQMTIFFCDIVGFTTISESMSPEELAQRMGVYFDGMTKIILKYNGTVDKYIGDSIMAFWGAPHLCDDQAVKACKATLECRQFVEELSEKWEKEGLTGFHTRFGINSGEAVVGNFGYSERLNYTVMGDNVNLASRLEGLNKQYGTKIMISESTYLQARHVIVGRILDRAVVKGKTIGVTVYEVIGKIEDVNEEDRKRIDSFNTGMETLLSGNVPEAKTYFEEMLTKNPDCKWIPEVLDRIASKDLEKV